ncbi:MAG: hypothetical protein HPM95_14985 [Alphaproteobacteria bacterium]|nr:hypothetical protein [Alphaproteobacteria bacterium]
MLSVQVGASEPRGGLAARLPDRGLPAVDFSLTGDGTLDDWKAEPR